MGSIYKRGAIFWVQYYKNGRPFRESSKSKKEVDAKRLLARRMGEIAVGKQPSICFERIKFDELATDFLQDYRINERKSLTRAELSVRHLKEHFEGCPIPALITPRINGYIEARLGAGAANGTVNRELAALKRMLRLGKNQNKVDKIPFVPKLEENNVRKGFFEAGQFEALREVLPDYLKPVAQFGYNYGWRLGEILGLKWRNFDLEQGTVRLEPGETKNKQARTIYLDPADLEMFSAMHAERQPDQPYVFLRDGERIKSFRKAWHSACRKVGLNGRLFHDFRRTACRDMNRAGISERVCMEISGHKTRSVFDRYNIVSDRDLQEARDRRQMYRKEQNKHKTATILPLKRKKASTATG